MLRRVGSLAAVGAAIGSVGCSTNDASEPPGEVHVDMTDELDFDPRDVTVAVDGTVVWENVGVVPHSVTAYADRIPSEADYFASGGFDDEGEANREYPQRGSVGAAETYAYTFETPGRYEYYCIPHEAGDMIGTVTVE